MTRTKVVIVGAGIGGLALSRALARRDVPHVVLERDAEPGGVIRTLRVDGRVLEVGPQRLRLTRRMRKLVRALGLHDQLLIARRGLPLLIYRDGALRRAPQSLADLRHTDLFSRREKLRILAEPFTGAVRDDETVADYFTRRFGHAAYENLLGPLFGGLYASDPADMLARHTLMPLLRELGGGHSAVLTLLRRTLARGGKSGGRRRGDLGRGARAFSFRLGLRTLTDAMYRSVRDHVRLGTAAVGIEPGAEGYRVVTDSDELTADDVVLTCPAWDAARLLRTVAPRSASALDALHYNRIAIVHMIAKRVRAGMGYQASFAESLNTRGVTFNHSLFPRGHVYTAFLGGARAPDIVDDPDDALAALAAREFEHVTGRAARPINVSRSIIPAWDRSWTAIDDLELPRHIHLCTNYESRIGVPGRITRAEQIAAAIA